MQNVRTAVFGLLLASLAATGCAANANAHQKSTASPAAKSTPPTAKPGEQSIDSSVQSAHEKYRSLKEGKNADYIPVLAEVDSELFGIAVVTVDGKVSKTGDTDALFSIQSISKVFTLALIIEALGPKAIEDKIGVDATGMVFNSIVAVEQKEGKEINPLVNPGALAAVSLVPGDTGEAKWQKIVEIHNQFAGRDLQVNEPVYKSEAETNERNRAIATLLHAYERLYFDPTITTDVYTRQCALNVSALDLAVMAATLANGGKNPITGKRVVSEQTTAHVLAVMATAGLYDDSGIWLYNVGLPAKSGVGGGLIAVAPGRFGIAVFSPPLDEAGNSVRGQRAITDIVNALNANAYLVQPR